MDAKLFQIVRPDCWNLYQSFGEICVHCGCCSDDPSIRFPARISVAKETMNEKKKFSNWAWTGDLKRVQIKNIQADLRFGAREIRKYRRLAKQVGVY